jgi:hypothetical protein
LVAVHRVGFFDSVLGQGAAIKPCYLSKTPANPAAFEDARAILAKNEFIVVAECFLPQVEATARGRVPKAAGGLLHVRVHGQLLPRQ